MVKLTTEKVPVHMGSKAKDMNNHFISVRQSLGDTTIEPIEKV